MTDDDRRRAAQAALEIPFFVHLLDELEKSAVNACIFAKYDDHEARQAFAAEARAIKRVRQSLEVLSKDDEASPARQAPA